MFLRNGKTTDRLLKEAYELASVPNDRELDVLLSSGEQISISKLSILLNKLGYNSISLTGWQAGIYTNNTNQNAVIENIDISRIVKELGQRKIVIIAGFQGLNSALDITTLGRGGSDTSAVALAGALKAKRCDIYTDVEGVYTTDPRIVPHASKLKEISYEEMLELARVGANVLHPRAVEAATQYHMPVRVRSTFKLDNLATLMLGVEKMELHRPVTGVAADLSQLRIVVCDVQDCPGTAAVLFDGLAKENISVDMIIQSYARKNLNINDIAFTIDKNDEKKTLEILEKVKEKLHFSNVYVDDTIAKISIVGAGMIDRPGIAAKMFRALADMDINIKMISTSEIKISCLVEQSRANDAVEVLHTIFGLNCDSVAEVKGDLPNV